MTKYVVWVLLLVIWMVLIVFTWPATAHEHYPPECCSDRDCHRVPSNTVRKIGDEWHVETADGELVFQSGKVREPIDGDFHACWFPGTTWTFCFFPADGGV